ncbi:MAG: hypothetical protein HC809_05565 [Gammaproteobacteria bacterium]|nr:hypothetical protein [Gammaproteobacteria bacterium]
MQDDPYLLITADTHAGGSHAQYREYLEPKYRDAFDEWRGGYRNPSQEHYGRKKLRNWDLAVRTEDQNSQGVVGEVIFPIRCLPSFARASSPRSRRGRRITNWPWRVCAHTTVGSRTSVVKIRIAVPVSG